MLKLFSAHVRHTSRWEAHRRATISSLRGWIQHGIACALTFRVVGVGDGIDYALCLLMTNLCAHETRAVSVPMLEIEARTNQLTLVVFDDITDMIAATIVGFAHAHGVVCEVDIAVIACVGRLR